MNVKYTIEFDNRAGDWIVNVIVGNYRWEVYENERFMGSGWAHTEAGALRKIKKAAAHNQVYTVKEGKL